MQGVNSCEKASLPLSENQVQQNKQHFPATAVGVQEGEFMLVNLSLIFGSTIVGFSLYHLGHAFLDFTLILSETSALNLLLLSKTTHLTIGV